MDGVVPNNISLQLLKKITYHFSQDRMIGSGSYVTVYKGMHKYEENTAVKLLHGMAGLDDQQFKNEFNCLKRINHQNIVRLLGYCYETKDRLVNRMGKVVSAEKRYEAPCLEYMNNGSPGNYISDEYRGLNWSTCYKIIKGICERKDLHDELKPPIYHLELKPANVLLDENMLPVILGFGLSRLLREEQTHIIKHDRETEHPTLGRREYDVYSLGVVFMKIMAGRTGHCKSTDMSSEEFIELVHALVLAAPDVQPVRDFLSAGRSRRSTNIDCVVPNNISLQLLEEITDGFSDHRMIGSGSSGKVYMGVHKDGKKIAVKLLYGMPGLNDEQFQNEFNYLKRLDHPNIVRLVGCCYETKDILVNHMGKLVLAEKRYTALCLEYMNKGSLDNYLSDEYTGHSWSTRYKIIKGICDGLKYIHEELKPPIYHLDLKPANVLLDENWLPKISDFGLSKLFGEEQTQIVRNDRGTDVYTPPEYKKEGVVSMKFDIFSLGVVIMKIMAGRTGYHESQDMSSRKFIELVHGNWRNRLQEKFQKYSAQIKTCIEIAVRCVEYDRNKRPTIGDIVHELDNTELYMWTKIWADELFSIHNEISLEIIKLNPGLRNYSGSADMFFQQVHRNGRNRPTPAEDRRCRSGKTRHMNSSSASRYTLTTNWKY